MRLSNYILLLTLLLSACKAGVPLGYDYTPAMLHLDKSKQHDSLGFNLVTAIPQLVYGKILSNDLALWSSPDKKIQISSTEFTDQEKKARLPFVEGQNLFMHQVWRIYKRNFSFGIIGFSFAGETRSGEKINYGFIDAADIFALMRDRKIPCNANGSSQLTYLDAINSMSYHFNLVQFGTDNFKTNPLRSFQLKDQALKSKRIRRNLHKIPQIKEIEYKVAHPSISSNAANKNLYNTFESFVNNNKQTILNAGGGEHLAPMLFKPWKVDNIRVVEQWSLLHQLPLQELLYVELFIEGQGVRLYEKDLDEMGIRINMQGAAEYFSGKEFQFIIQRINAQEISAHESEAYYAALMNSAWNKIKN